LLAFGLAAAYVSVYMLPLSIFVLFVVMYFLMEFFGKRFGKGILNLRFGQKFTKSPPKVQ
jgi:hypothetical protein